MYIHRRDIQYDSSSGKLLTRRTQQAEAEHEISINIPADTAEMLVAFELDITQLRGFFMHADGPLKVETNEVLAPKHTFELIEGEPIHYLAGGLGTAANEPHPFAEDVADVTALYVTNEPPDWVGATVYAKGEVVRPTTPNTYKYVCTVAGTSLDGDEPVWPTTVGGLITDGTVTWKCVAGVTHLDIRALIDPTV